MWEKSGKCTKRLIGGLSLISFMLCWPLCSYAQSCVDGYSTPTTGQPTSITMSLTRYNQLKEIISRQDNRLTQLQQKLTLLKSDSTEASKELVESQNELNRLKEELTATQKSLERAKISLTQAEEILKRQEASLQTLTKQIKEMEHKQTVLRRQRDVWAAVAALSLGGVIARR